MTGSILAGGKSRRMGFDKAFIELEGTTIIKRSVALFKDIFGDVSIIANDVLLYEGFGVRVASDVIKDAGSLGGIYTALFHSSSDFTFIAACDMPRLDRETIVKMTSASAGCNYHAIVPFIGNRYHPLHAIYSKKCLKPIEAMIREKDLRISGLFDNIRTLKLDEGFFEGLPIASSVENINTGEDLVRIKGGG